MKTATGITADHFLNLVGETIVDARVVGDNLIIETLGGFEIDAGNVKGLEAENPTAANVSVSPESTISSTNVQTAVSELVGDHSALVSGKAEKTALPKLLHGRLVHVTEIGDQFGNTVRTQVDYPTVFPLGYFSDPPDVFVMLNTSAPEIFAVGYSVLNVTNRGFSFDCWRQDTNATVFMWIAMGS